MILQLLSVKLPCDVPQEELRRGLEVDFDGRDVWDPRLRAGVEARTMTPSVEAAAARAVRLAVHAELYAEAEERAS